MMVFQDFRNLKWLREVLLVSDTLWCLIILTNFCKQNERGGRLVLDEIKSCSLGFWIFLALDLLSVLPLVLLEESDRLEAFHLCRYRHILTGLEPVGWLLKQVMPNAKPFMLEAWQNLMQYFVASLLLVHMTACIFIYIGYLDKTIEDESLRASWLTVTDN